MNVIKSFFIKQKKHIKILFLVFLFYTILCFILANIVLSLIFKKIDVGNSRYESRYSSFIPRDTVTFMSGKNKLTGYLYDPSKAYDLNFKPEDIKGLVVISHGYTSNADSYLDVMEEFVKRGWRVFSFNNTGVWESEGKSMGGISQSVVDLDAALTYVESNPELSNLPIVLFGHSWGGYAATSVLNFDHPKIIGVVSMAGFNNPEVVYEEWGTRYAGFAYYIIKPHALILSRIKYGKNFSLSSVDGINKSNARIFLVHANDDEVISFNNAGTISYKSEITNPNVIYFPRADGYTHHNLYDAKDYGTDKDLFDQIEKYCLGEE